MYKMVDISKKTYENNDIEVIVDGIGIMVKWKAHRRKLFIKIYQSSKTNDPVYKKHR